MNKTKDFYIENFHTSSEIKSNRVEDLESKIHCVKNVVHKLSGRS